MIALSGLVERVPTKAPPLGAFIAEEIAVRGWTLGDLAARMGGDALVNRHLVESMIHAPDRNLALDEGIAAGLGKAFDLRPGFFLALNEAWRRGMSWA